MLSPKMLFKLPGVADMLNALARSGFSENSLSAHIGVSQGSISKLRSNQSEPKIGTYEKVFNFYLAQIYLGKVDEV